MIKTFYLDCKEFENIDNLILSIKLISLKNKDTTFYLNVDKEKLSLVSGFENIKQYTDEISLDSMDIICKKENYTFNGVLLPLKKQGDLRSYLAIIDEEDEKVEEKITIAYNIVKHFFKEEIKCQLIGSAFEKYLIDKPYYDKTIYLNQILQTNEPFLIINKKDFEVFKMTLEAINNYLSEKEENKNSFSKLFSYFFKNYTNNKSSSLSLDNFVSYYEILLNEKQIEINLRKECDIKQFSEIYEEILKLYTMNNQ